MSARHKIYLAGPISGCEYRECTDWRKDVTQRLSPLGVECLSPMRAKEYLEKVGKIEGSYPELGAFASAKGIMSRDHWDCMRADLVFFNLLGATRVSIGTVMELAWAWADHAKPTVVVMEKEGNIHAHPMVDEAIRFAATTIDEGIHLVRAILNLQEGH